MKKTIADFLDKKQRQQKITALTCYDYPHAVLQEQAGIDIIFVGDSVGTNILGYASETEVTLADIVHHLKAVRRGAQNSFILADLPYGSYPEPAKALASSRVLMEAGADIVKLEGVELAIVATLVEQNIPVCGHIGLQPQTHQKKVVQGKSFVQARELLEGAIALEKAGVVMLVLELVPEPVGRIITENLTIPTIGIGAGRFTDGQVLVVNDILGMSDRQLKLAKRYQNYRELTYAAIQQYQAEVEQQQFPAVENTSSMPAEELSQFLEWLTNRG